MSNEEFNYYPLASKVLAVAVVNTEMGEWSAYCDAVPGMKHSDEWQAVASTGDKLSPKIASEIFPYFAKKYTWRR